jgi:hypothetical protein
VNGVEDCGVVLREKVCGGGEAIFVGLWAILEGVLGLVVIFDGELVVRMWFFAWWMWMLGAHFSLLESTPGFAGLFLLDVFG